MASKNRESNFNLKDQLLKSSRNFTFIQTYRLLSLLLKEESHNQEDLKNPIDYIRIRPELSLEFPTADVVAIEEIATNDQLNYQITTTFLGLYGASSPLPTFYTENLFREQADDNCLNREFIDIFNNHLYQIFFEIWSTHRLSYQIFEKHNPRHLSYLHSLGGLSDKNIIKIIPEKYNPLRYLSILGHLPKTAYWLKTLLVDLLEIDAIEIEECVDVVLAIPKKQHLTLGNANNILGESTHLGEQVISTDSAFSIQIGPISYDQYKTMMPKTAKFQLINQIVTSYMDTPLLFNIKFRVLSTQNMGIQLGIQNNAYLGYDTWLFNHEDSRYLEHKVCFENSAKMSA